MQPTAVRHTQRMRNFITAAASVAEAAAAAVVMPLAVAASNETQ